MTVADTPNPQESRPLQIAMLLSLAVGFFMLATKILAYWMTGSAAILSDASESVVHVVAVSFAAYSLGLSQKPPDPSHLYGHDKVAFFSAGFEGAMIALAACYIVYISIQRMSRATRIATIGSKRSQPVRMVKASPTTTPRLVKQSVSTCLPSASTITDPYFFPTHTR